MTAAVMSILPKRRGRAAASDPMNVLRLFPWGRDGRVFIYAIAFEGDVVKVGQTQSPRKRLTQHWRSVRGEVRWMHLFESMHGDTARSVEYGVAESLKGIAEQINGSEWFFATASKAQVIGLLRPVIFQAKEATRARWLAEEERKKRIDAMARVLEQHGLLPKLGAI